MIHSQIAHTSTAVYVIGLIKTRASYTLHVTALSASTGAYLASAQIPSQIRDGLTDFLVLSPPLNHSPDKPAVTYPHVVWLDQGNMHFAPLTPELDGKVKHIKGTTYKRILNVGLNEIGWFVALKSDGSGLVMRFDEDSMGLKMLWEFSESVRVNRSSFTSTLLKPLQATSERYTDSHYTGGFDNHSRPYVGRVFWSHHFGVSFISFIIKSLFTNVFTCSLVLVKFSLHTELRVQVSFVAALSHLTLVNMGLLCMYALLPSFARQMSLFIQSLIDEYEL